jgi:hypothetical protein
LGKGVRARQAPSRERETTTNHGSRFPLSLDAPSGEANGVDATAKTTRSTVADLKNLLRQEAARCRRLAELVTEQTIRQALIEMAARLEALAIEDHNDEQ